MSLAVSAATLALAEMHLAQYLVRPVATLLARLEVMPLVLTILARILAQTLTLVLIPALTPARMAMLPLKIVVATNRP